MKRVQVKEAYNDDTAAMEITQDFGIDINYREHIQKMLTDGVVLVEVVGRGIKQTIISSGSNKIKLVYIRQKFGITLGESVYTYYDTAIISSATVEHLPNKAYSLILTLKDGTTVSITNQE